MTTPAPGLRGERYVRIMEQLRGLLLKTDDPIARMATVVAVLHHKMPHFFWTGFYRLVDEKLIVGPYQGPVACAVLPGPQGVCWACVRRGESILVPDVHVFSGHVACDPRSKSEVVVPLRGRDGQITGVLDADSDKIAAFTAEDVAGLEAVIALMLEG